MDGVHPIYGEIAEAWRALARAAARHRGLLRCDACGAWSTGRADGWRAVHAQGRPGLRVTCPECPPEALRRRV